MIPVGTRSLLWGSHQFLLHPCFVFLGWWRLRGFPRDPRLYCAFALHDIGYWGRRSMDGTEPGGGQFHPERGARIMGRLFGQEWHDFTIGHSRYYARAMGIPTSPLMEADKLATCLIPLWLYAALVRLSGEWHEYLQLHIDHGYDGPPTLLGWARHLRAEWRERYDVKEADLANG